MKTKLKWLYDACIYYPIFLVSLTSMGLIAKLKLDKVNHVYARVSARVVLFSRRAKRHQDIDSIGWEWKKMFPNDMQRFIKKEDETVYYETHTWCSLRGTGDVDACYRIMEFDRAMHEKLGGEFVVLASQAEPGRKTCIVAMRKAGQATVDLEHAHQRVAKSRGERIPAVTIEE